MTPRASADLQANEYHDNDVLCGRGGWINSHPGNERFRNLVKNRNREYFEARFKREKRRIASSIVSEIHALNPPGRFLTKDLRSGHWVNIGKEKAREKTAQALRENLPAIRAKEKAEVENSAAAPDPNPPPMLPPPPYFNQQSGFYAPFYGGYGPPQGAQQQYPPPCYSGAPPIVLPPWPMGSGPYTQATRPPNEDTSAPIIQRSKDHSHDLPQSSQERPDPINTLRPEDSDTPPPGDGNPNVDDSTGKPRHYHDLLPPKSPIVRSNAADTSLLEKSEEQQDGIAHTAASHGSQAGQPSYQHQPQSSTSLYSPKPFTGPQDEPSSDPTSLLSQVAHHILGAWDDSAMSCATRTHGNIANEQGPEETTDLSMDIGQEVELAQNIIDFDMEDAVEVHPKTATPPQEVESEGSRTQSMVPELGHLPPLSTLHWLYGSCADINRKYELCLLIQPNCPDCLVHALPMANALAASKHDDFGVYCVSTAFEDFEYNTVESTQQLLLGNLVGIAKERLGPHAPAVPITPVAHDVVIPKVQAPPELIQLALAATKNNASEQRVGRALELVLHRALERIGPEVLPEKLATMFYAVSAKGTPTWVFHDNTGRVLGSQFGLFFSEEDLLNWILRTKKRTRISSS